MRIASKKFKGGPRAPRGPSRKPFERFFAISSTVAPCEPHLYPVFPVQHHPFHLRGDGEAADPSPPAPDRRAAAPRRSFSADAPAWPPCPRAPGRDPPDGRQATRPWAAPPALWALNWSMHHWVCPTVSVSTEHSQEVVPRETKKRQSFSKSSAAAPFTSTPPRRGCGCR